MLRILVGLFGVIGGGGSDDMVFNSFVMVAFCFFIWRAKRFFTGRQGFLETAVIKIGRMTNITEVLVQIKSNKREGKKHLAQG